MNSTLRNSRWLPYFIGFLTVAMLAMLGVWQISRGLEKRASLEAFQGETGPTRYTAGTAPRPFQQLRVEGRFLPEQQLLLDNAIVAGENGHFVIAVLQLAGTESHLLVNRGWVPKASVEEHRELIRLESVAVKVTGRAGQLPRAGMRMGEPFFETGTWPQYAVFPTADEVSALLGVSLEPFVLLLDPAEPIGFVREWSPEEMSANRHFGYAFQWFAMAAVLSGMLIWQRRKRRKQ